MKMFIILDMKKNKIDNFSLKIIVLTATVKTGVVLTAQPWIQTEMYNMYDEHFEIGFLKYMHLVCCIFVSVSSKELILFVLNRLRWEVVVHFVDIGRMLFFTV